MYIQVGVYCGIRVEVKGHHRFREHIQMLMLEWQVCVPRAVSLPLVIVSH